MPTTTRDGIKLAYEERGSGTPAFVFVHGWTCDRSFFAPQAEYFARKHRVVSLDLRGHGESDKPAGRLPISDLRRRHRPPDRHARPRPRDRGGAQHGRHHRAPAGARASREGGGHRHGGSRAAGLPPRAAERHRGPGGCHRGGQSGPAPPVIAERPLPPHPRQGPTWTGSSKHAGRAPPMWPPAPCGASSPSKGSGGRALQGARAAHRRDPAAQPAAHDERSGCPASSTAGRSAPATSTCWRLPSR